ncbi:MAG: hypothetical protein R3352_07730 [Salinisphaeraceae bacterium]|nr:hypothetical protein [Salinisphaeraceae bacterium]
MRNGLLAAIALPTFIPLGMAFASLASPSAHLDHLIRIVLPDVVSNTLLLLVTVSLSAAVLGTGLAWLTARYHFPGVKVLHAALLLPLAMPGYVLGFVFIAGFDYAGPMQSFWRELSGSHEALWQARSLGGIGAWFR